MYCENCGTRYETINHSFCELCGKQNSKDVEIVSKVPIIRQAVNSTFANWEKKTTTIGIVIAVIICSLLISVFVIAVSDFNENDPNLATTNAILEELKLEVERLRNATTTLGSTNELAKTAFGVANTSGNYRQVSSKTSLQSWYPSIVNIVCLQSATGSSLMGGSGVLYFSPNSSPAQYFIETNKHVIETADGSPPQCVFAIYPEPSSPKYYVYKAVEIYSAYNYADFAYLGVELLEKDIENQGGFTELEKYSKNIYTRSLCTNLEIGEPLSVLGFPGVGGNSLTVTNGIVSGFEIVDSIRYIKTSAKIEHGNSGGVAITDSGCVVGIPTFAHGGEIESLGRIMDLNYLLGNHY